MSNVNSPGSKQKFVLHPLIHTILRFAQAQDIVGKLTEKTADRDTRRSETRGMLETYTHCMGHGLLVGNCIGPNYTGSCKDVLRFRRLNNQAKKILRFWHFDTLDKCATEADILDSSNFGTIRSY